MCISTAENDLSIIEEELLSIARQFDNIQRTTNSTHEKMNEVSSMIDEFNVESVISDINATVSDAFDSLTQARTNCKLIWLSCCITSN